MTSGGSTIWKPAWIIGGAMVAAMAALVAISFWVATLDVATRPEVLSGAEFALNWAELGWRLDAVVFGSSVVVASLILARDRAHRYGWVLLGATGVAPILTMSTLSALLLSIDGKLPSSWAPWLAALIPALIVVTIASFLSAMALFPTGRAHATVWSRGLSGFWMVWGLLAVTATLAPGASWAMDAERAWTFDNPLGLDALGWFDPIWVDGVAIVFALFVIASVVARYRVAESEVRHQIKWVMLAAVVVVVVSVLPIQASTIGYYQTAAGFLLVVALGFAITKYRLYEIDLIINRALVYASLAVFIGVVYVGVVVGVGSLVGSGDEPNAVLSVGATALVAVGFQPVRRRLERVANRLVFGRKATPYEVLSEFSRRVAATSDDLLDDAARWLAEGTRAERVAISVMIDGESAEAAVWPRDTVAGSIEPVSFPIADTDTTLGSLDVYLPAGQHLQDDDRRLAEQLSSGMGLALRNQLLTERLEARVEELRESRRRLVAVQDETRRRLERDLHDGAQQQLVALKVKLGLGRAIAEKDGATQTAQLLERLSGEADAAVDAMREFARGVYPPLLEAEGLSSAISAQARRAPIPVSVNSDGIGRYPREIESTVYFCVLEALRNIVQHADASQAVVTLTQSNGSLEFQVTDDGAGFPTQADMPDRGVGLTAMADRLDALTGELTIHTEPGNGTTLTGTIPVPVEVPA
jgi:signal transduction histidine kinase